MTTGQTQTRGTAAGQAGELAREMGGGRLGGGGSRGDRRPDGRASAREKGGGPGWGGGDRRGPRAPGPPAAGRNGPAVEGNVKRMAPPPISSSPTPTGA